jgi:trimeric autotransporter adhesin
MSATAYGNFTTLSTGTLSTGTALVGSLSATFLSGDGSGITNLSRTSYVPYSIPLTALNPYGNLNIQYGNWIHGGLISPNTLSVATTIQTSSIDAINAGLSNLSAGVINTGVLKGDYVSTHTLDVETNFFRTQYGEVQYLVSSFASSLYTHVFKADELGVQTFVASTATFSTLTTQTWLVDALQPNYLSLLDVTTGRPTSLVLSTGILYIGTSSIYSSVVTTPDIVSTTTNVLFRLNLLSNAINPFPTLSIMSTFIGSSFQTLQITASTLSTSLGTSVESQNIALSNISAGLQANIINLSNYTITNTSNLSTTVSARFATGEAATAAQITANSNYFRTSTNSLFLGLSTAAILLANSIDYNTSNLSSTTGSNTSNLTKFTTDLSNYTNIKLVSTFSTLSTQAGVNYELSQANMTTAMSNLSVTTQAGLVASKSGISSVASILSTSIGSTLSTVLTALSSFSTQAGYDSQTLRIGVSSVSTQTGSNFSTVQFALSSLSSIFSLNFSTAQIGISTVGTATQVGLSTVSTMAGSNFSTLQSGLSTVSTILGSNLSTLTTGLSTFSTVTGSNLSTLTTGLSTLSTAMGRDSSTLRVGVSSVATLLNGSISSLFFSTAAAVYSTGITLVTLSNTSASTFSTLSTSIGLTSNFLSYSSTLSSQAGWNFSTLALGLSTVSSAIGSFPSTAIVNFSTSLLFASSLSSGNAYISLLAASTVSTRNIFAPFFQGSTMSSLTMQTGLLSASVTNVSSYSGNLGDAVTMLIQYL